MRLVFLILLPMVAEACDCYSRESPCSVMSRVPRPENEAVFLGKVLRLYHPERTPGQGPQWGDRLTEIGILENFHNAPGEKFTLSQDYGCDAVLIPGAEYLVFASQNSQSKRWSASMCGHTGLALQRHAEIAVLRAEKKHPVLLVSIAGNRPRQPPLGFRFPRPELLEGVKVELSDGQNKTTATTDWFGNAVFTGLEASWYWLSAQASGWDFGAAERKIPMKGAWCQEIEIRGEESPPRYLIPDLPPLPPVNP